MKLRQRSFRPMLKNGNSVNDLARGSIGSRGLYRSEHMVEQTFGICILWGLRKASKKEQRQTEQKDREKERL